jgi:phage tail-like protein
MKKHHGKISLILLIIAVLVFGIYVSGIGSAGAVVTSSGKEDPLVGFYHYQLSVNGISMGYFTEVYGIGSENEVMETRIFNPGSNKEIIQKMPSRLKWMNIELIRGISSNKNLWDWRGQVISGDIKGARRNCTITMFDQTAKPVASWNLINAWPSKIEAPMIKGDNKTVGVEIITLAHEGLTRVK